MPLSAPNLGGLGSPQRPNQPRAPMVPMPVSPDLRGMPKIFNTTSVASTDSAAAMLASSAAMVDSAFRNMMTDNSAARSTGSASTAGWCVCASKQPRHGWFHMPDVGGHARSGTRTPSGRLGQGISRPTLHLSCARSPSEDGAGQAHGNAQCRKPAGERM